MRLVYSQHFIRSLKKAPSEIQRAFGKQAGFLLQNLGHPSLRSKKYDESQDLWQARVTGDWRFYFTIRDDMYIIHDIVPHPK